MNTIPGLLKIKHKTLTLDLIMPNSIKLPKSLSVLLKQQYS